jgi:hypothetical protein
VRKSVADNRREIHGENPDDRLQGKHYLKCCFEHHFFFLISAEIILSFFPFFGPSRA